MEELRNNRGLSKGEFSEKFGGKSSNYATLLKSKTINGELSGALSRAFEVNLNWLITGTGEMYNEDKALERPCNLITLARSTIAYALEDEAHQVNAKLSVFFGVINESSMKSYERVSEVYLKELNRPYKIIDVEGLTREEFFKAFRAYELKQIEHKIYGDDTVWIIKNLSLSKMNSVENIYNDLMKMLDSAYIKGLSPKGSFIFIDYASFLEKYNDVLISAYVGNIEN